MEFKTAAEMRKENEKPQRAFEKYKEYQMKEIKKANAAGRNRALFYDSGTFEGQYYDFKDKMKDWLESLGYRIVPTGYIGGVWQLTSDVTW